MAGFNEILVGRWNKALNDIFSIKAGAPSPSVAGDLQPVVALDQPGSVDRRWGEGWDRFGFSSNVAASVGNQTGFKLRNPPGSGIICVIEKLRWGATISAGGGILFSFNNGSITPDVTDLASQQNAPKTAFDGRTKRNGALIISLQNSTPAISSTNYQFFDAYLNTGAGSFFNDLLFHVDDEIQMTPGTALLVVTNIVNQSLELTVWWRERYIEESELT